MKTRKGFKDVVIKKPHKCHYCEKEFPIGTKMRFEQSRQPLIQYGAQVGIRFVKRYSCVDFSCLQNQSQ